MLINYTMWSSNLFFCIQSFPAFFIVHNFQSPDFSGSRFFSVQVFQDPDFSGSRFFLVHVFLDPGFSGSIFFRIHVQDLGPGFSGSGSKVWVQVLEVANPPPTKTHPQTHFRLEILTASCNI